MAIRRSLLIGCNYSGTPYPLKGCINDITAVAQILRTRFGFDDPLQNRMLADRSCTTANILERLNWLVEGLTPGDVAFLHYSGHGSQIPVTDYDLEEEPDGLDEIICPIDIDWRTRLIKDKDLKSIFSKVPPGVNITVLSDSCHSGGLLREIELPIELRELLKGPNRIKSIPMPVDIENRSAGQDLQPKPRSLQDPQLVAIEDQSGILISGCKSDQTSADAYFQQNRAYHGAATFAFMRVLEKHNYTIGYGDLVHEMNLILEDLGYEQRPELNASSTLFDKPFLSSFN